MRDVITAETWGQVYLGHMSRALGNPDNKRAQARHYAGFALDAALRIKAHEKGQGAAITRAAVAQGITFTWHVWDAPLGMEKWLKARKRLERFCPVCCQLNGWALRTLPSGLQLALPLDSSPAEWDDDGDFPEPPVLTMDSYEFLRLRAMRDARTTLTAGPSGHLDDDLL